MTDLLDRFENDAIRSKNHGKQRFYSDKLKWFIVAIFIIALLFKNRHWPFAGILMVGCGGLSVLFIIGQIIEGARHKDLTRGLFGASVGLCMLYLVFRFQFWSGAAILFVLALAVKLATTFYLGTRRQKSEFKPLSAVLIAVCIFIFTLANSTLFYYTNMSETLNKREHYHSSYAWAKYGDLLREEGNEKEAAMAYLKSFECASHEEGGEVYKELLDDLFEN